MTAPVWLRDEPWLQAWLGWFLDRLDNAREAPRNRAITRRIKKSALPALYEFGEDTKGRWQLLEKLATEYGIFEIRYAKNLAPYQEHYENAQFRLNPDSEPLLREWLNRPEQDPHLLAWQAATNQQAKRFIDRGQALLEQRPDIPGWSPDEIVEAFLTIQKFLDQSLTLREISARCFNGDSKFLDNRHDLLLRLYGQIANSIQPRPLLLTAWAPPGFTSLLIIENQDSFLRLVERPPEGFALLYSGGFRASATRLGSDHTRFSFLPGSDPERFQNHWLRNDTPRYFWGDLDFSGMGILKALRNSLPALKAWKPGFLPMLEMLKTGCGHTAPQAGKIGQSDPGTTGCSFSDQQLLPALRERLRFIDQESISPVEESDDR